MRRCVHALATAGLGLAAALALSPAAAAAPYSSEAVIEVSTSNPAVGGTLALTAGGFLPTELVDLVLHSTPFPLGTLTANSQGAVSAVVELPEHLTCRHHLTATGRTSGEQARADLVIGDPAACAADGGGGAGNTGGGNTGSGNSGHGNSGHGNSGHGNSGHGNSGHGNVGHGNVGHGNTGKGNVGHGNTPYAATPSYGPDGDPGRSRPEAMTYRFEPVSSGSTTLAAGTVAATAVLGGVLFLTQRRRGW